MTGKVHQLHICITLLIPPLYSVTRSERHESQNDGQSNGSNNDD
jgi:hypothetical protein